MTETEWQNATDPQVMLEFLRTTGKLTDRKARLFAVAGCRRIWHLLTDERSRRAVEIAERFADGFAGDEELNEACGQAWEAVDDLHGGGYVVEHASRAASWAAAEEGALLTSIESAVQNAASETERAATSSGVAWTKEVADQSHLLRDLFGPLPFRPITLSPSLRTWNFSTLVRLATSIYEERAFERMPVLGDALEEAGCESKEVIEHCRGRGVHVKGCWVLDAVLGEL